MAQPIKIIVRGFDRETTGYTDLVPFKVKIDGFPIFNNINFAWFGFVFNTIVKNKMQLKAYSDTLTAFSIDDVNVKIGLKASLPVDKYSINLEVNSFMLFKAFAETISVIRTFGKSKFGIKGIGTSNISINFDIDSEKMYQAILHTLGYWDGENDDTTLGDMDDFTIEELGVQEYVVYE